MSDIKQEGITAKKGEDFDEWYTQAILKSEFADYSPVSGCLVYRPSGYAVWEKIRDATDLEFKKAGIQNAYFPLFIPERLLKKEQEHVEGFAPEVAWVTEAGELQARGETGGQAHLRDDNLRSREEMDPILAGPAAQAQPMEQRREVGVQAPHALPEREGVPLERGAHDVRDQGGGRRGARPDTGNLPDDNRGVPGAPRPDGQEDREREVRGRPGELQHRARDAEREGDTGPGLPLGRPELLQGFRPGFRGPEGREADWCGRTPGQSPRGRSVS